jgi:hypothetical protein
MQNILLSLSALATAAKGHTGLPPSTGSFFYTDYYMLKSGVHEASVNHLKSGQSLMLMMNTETDMTGLFTENCAFKTCKGAPNGYDTISAVSLD